MFGMDAGAKLSDILQQRDLVMKPAPSFISAHPVIAGAIVIAAIILVIAIIRVLSTIMREKKAAAEARRLRAEKAEKAENLSYFFTKK